MSIGTLLADFRLHLGSSRIKDKAFYNCTSLTSITLGNSVESIGNSTFYGCSNLGSIIIPESVKSIGCDAFYGEFKIYCEAESKPSGWDSKWKYSHQHVVWGFQEYGTTSDGFAWYKKNDEVCIDKYTGSSKTLEIPSTINDKNVTSIGDWAFSWCTSLTSVIIPDSITSIGERAFYECNNLTSVTIGDSVTSIGDGAFYSCEYLTNLIIPNSVTSIGTFAFSYCTSLTIYCEAESKPSGWDDYWNYSNRPVVWGYTGE